MLAVEIQGSLGQIVQAKEEVTARLSEQLENPGIKGHQTPLPESLFI